MTDINPLATFHHDVGNITTIVSSYLSEDTNIEELSEKWNFLKDPDNVAESEHFLKKAGEFMKELKGETRPGPNSNYLEEAIESAQKLAELYPDTTAEGFKDFARLAPRMREYIQFQDSGFEVDSFNGIQIGDLMEELEIYDEFEVEYSDSVDSETLVKGNGGLVFPFHTEGMNFDKYALNLAGNFDLSWEEVEEDPELSAEIDLIHLDDYEEIIEGYIGDPDAQYLRVRIGDNGPGLPEDVSYEKTFDPEFSTSGSGYGNPMKREMVEEYGGMVRGTDEAALESAFHDGKGHGTEFLLPVYQKSVQEKIDEISGY